MIITLAALIGLGQGLRDIEKAVVPLKTVSPMASMAEFEPIGQAVKHAEVVGLGEATHGSREIFQMKDRLFRYLATKCGFRLLAVESHLAQSIAMDRFVTEGIGTARTALTTQGFWTLQSVEIEDMLNWMRRENLRRKPSEKLRIVGIDMQGKDNAWDFLAAELKEAGCNAQELDDPTWLSRMSYERRLSVVPGLASAWVHSALPGLRRKYGAGADLLFQRVIGVLRQAIEHGTLISAQEDLYERPDAIGGIQSIAHKASEVLSSGKELSEKSRRALSILAGKEKPASALELRNLADAVEGEQGMEEYAAALVTLAALMELKAGTPQAIRDKDMASNLEWAISTYLPRAKAVLWGHNSHVGIIEMPGKFVSLGSHLVKRLGSAYCPFGTLFDHGGVLAIGSNGKVGSFDLPPAHADSWEGLLSGLNQPLFFLDLTRMSIQTTKPTRAIGSSYDPSRPDLYYENLPLAGLFRGVVFIKALTAARMGATN
ncbi:MAG: erythromycin esterase family protein [Fimbriimonas sp.]